MRRAMERNGSPLPILETDEQCTYFLTTLPVHPTFEGDQVNDQVSNQVNVETNEDSKRVLEVLSKEEGGLSSSELLQQLGLTAQTKNYKKYIAPALDRGWIERTVPDKPRSRNQKYWMTELGRAVLEG